MHFHENPKKLLCLTLNKCMKDCFVQLFTTIKWSKISWSIFVPIVSFWMLPYNCWHYFFWRDQVKSNVAGKKMTGSSPPPRLPAPPPPIPPSCYTIRMRGPVCRRNGTNLGGGRDIRGQIKLVACQLSVMESVYTRGDLVKNFPASFSRLGDHFYSK
jgi:hypothetical protein